MTGERAKRLGDRLDRIGSRLDRLNKYSPGQPREAKGKPTGGRWRGSKLVDEAEEAAERAKNEAQAYLAVSPDLSMLSTIPDYLD